MSSVPRITLLPPPHATYLVGYLGIPPHDPTSTLRARDPLHPPPVFRPQAHLAGTVDLRTPAKGCKGRFLRVELEKIESLPPPWPSPSLADGQDGVVVGRFVELIGTGPSVLWEAGVGSGEGGRKRERRSEQVVLRGDDERGVSAVIMEGEYPFRIPLPEGLPPTTRVDAKGSGISYQLVATLCYRSGKKSLLNSSPKYTVIRSVAPVVLTRTDTLPSWPIYAPLLPLHLSHALPWARGSELATGEANYARASVRGGSGDGNAGDVWMEAIRARSAYGAGDEVEMSVRVGWGGNRPIRLTRIDLVLRETIVYRYPSSDSPRHASKTSPRISTIFAATTAVSSPPTSRRSFAILHPNEPLRYTITGTIPAAHPRVTVGSAKHIGVAHHFKLRALLEGGEEVSIDQWAVTLGGVSYKASRRIVQEIGWVEGLCDRAGEEEEEEEEEEEDMGPMVPPKMRAPVALVPLPLPYPDANHHPYRPSSDDRRSSDPRSFDTPIASHHAPHPSLDDTEASFYQAERTGLTRATSKRFTLRDSLLPSALESPSRFDQAKAVARRRRQEAVDELERQNRLLEALEREELEETERETEVIRMRVGEVEGRRRELEARRRGKGVECGLGGRGSWEARVQDPGAPFYPNATTHNAPSRQTRNSPRHYDPFPNPLHTKPRSRASRQSEMIPLAGQSAYPSPPSTIAPSLERTTSMATVSSQSEGKRVARSRLGEMSEEGRDRFEECEGASAVFHSVSAGHGEAALPDRAPHLESNSTSHIDDAPRTYSSSLPALDGSESPADQERPARNQSASAPPLHRSSSGSDRMEEKELASVGRAEQEERE